MRPPPLATSALRPRRFGPQNPHGWISTNRRTYERMAIDYARHIDRIDFGREAARFVRLVGRTGGRLPRIADVGCGPGPDLEVLQALGARPLGIDIARAMVQRARNATRVQLTQADMRRLPLCSDSLDGIWCVAALGHLPPGLVAPTLAEFRRALRGGWLYVLVTVGEGVRAASFDGSLPRLFNDFTLSRLRACLVGAGFVVRDHHTYAGSGSRNWLRVTARAEHT
jgi:SAM-dependent methyltransferase